MTYISGLETFSKEEMNVSHTGELIVQIKCSSKQNCNQQLSTGWVFG